MGKPLNALKVIFQPKPKRPLTPAEKQAIDEQITIVEPITRGH